MSKNISNTVASAMNQIIKSAEHRSLFGNGYVKTASKEEDEEDSNCAKDHEHDDCDDSNDAVDYATNHPSFADWLKNNIDQLQAQYNREVKFPNANKVIMDELYPRTSEELNDPETSSLLTDQLGVEAALTVALDSLLTASAALDSANEGHASKLAVKLASFVSEAKAKSKKEKDLKKSKDSKDSKKSSKDSKDSKNSKDSKDSKKSSKDSKDKNSKSSKK